MQINLTFVRIQTVQKAHSPASAGTLCGAC
nr:MAG TPA: hypothetical protein [Caudoviricetes sp.]